MKQTILYFLISIFLVPLTSCEENLLEKEQYQKVIYLLSGDDNIYNYSHTLNDSITRGFLTVGSGGTMPLDKDVTVLLKTDSASLNEYNRRRFDIEYDKYAKYLDPTRFVLPSYEIVIRAGKANATTFFPIEIDANGLSPDTVYMIPFKIESISDCEINPEKSTVLYKVELVNNYTSPEKKSYSMKGTKQPEGGIISAITKTKEMTPISKNKVRIFPENLIVSKVLSDIEDKTIVLVVNDDNSVQVKPFKNIQVEHTGVNKYDEKTEVFQLSYRYKLPGDENWIYIGETLTRVK